jgi:hypothetical protein
MNDKQSVALELPPQIAQRFKNLPSRQKETLTLLIADWLSDNEGLDLPQIMDYIAFRAAKRGLTSEILQQLLTEEE